MVPSVGLVDENPAGRECANQSRVELSLEIEEDQDEFIDSPPKIGKTQVFIAEVDLDSALLRISFGKLNPFIGDIDERSCPSVLSKIQSMTADSARNIKRSFLIA